VGEMLRAGMSPAEVCRAIGLSRRSLRYWVRKGLDHEYHGGTVGGRRNWKFSAPFHAFLEAVIRQTIADNPKADVRFIAEKLQGCGLGRVASSWIRRVLKRWSFTNKQIVHKQANKFVRKNMIRYFSHVHTMPTIDPRRIKYFGECHWDARGCRTSRGWSLIGEPIEAVAESSFRGTTSVSLLVSLTSERPCWIPPPRTNTNCAWDFLDSVLWLIEQGALVPGDVFVVDGATVHTAEGIRDALTTILRIAQVTLVVLPPYSPELNPCEMVFGKVKRAVRRNWDCERPLWEAALDEFAAITSARVSKYYTRCIMAPLQEISSIY